MAGVFIDEVEGVRISTAQLEGWMIFMRSARALAANKEFQFGKT